MGGWHHLYRPFNIVLLNATERIQGSYISPGIIPAEGSPDPEGVANIAGWGSLCNMLSVIFEQIITVCYLTIQHVPIQLDYSVCNSISRR